MADDKIIIEFDGDIKKLKAKLGSSEKQVSKLKKASAGLGTVISKSAGVAAVAFGGVTAALIGAVNEAKKIESITTQFEVLTGSAKKAVEIVGQLQEFAATTPFQFEGIAKASQQLLGFGFAAEEIVPKLQQIGDVASAIGKPIDEVGFIFGQVAAMGKLSGERLLQFQERAIPIGPAIAKTMGIAESAVKDMVSAGKVDFETFEKAFASLSEKGSFAFGGMIKQSKTLGGLLSTVSDNLSLVAADIGKELLPAAKAIAGSFLTFLQNLQKTDNFIKTAVVFWGEEITKALSFDAEEATAELAEIRAEIDKNQEQMEILNRKAEAGRDSWLAKVTGGYQEATEQHSEFLVKNIELEQQYAELSQQITDNAAAAKAESERVAAEEERVRKEEARKKEEEEKLEAMTETERKIYEKKREAEAIETEAVAAHKAELEKLEKTRIKNENDARRSNAKDDLKAEIKENNLRAKEEARHGKALAASKAFFRSKEVEGTGQLLDNLATLGKSGNKELQAIAKAAAIARAVMNTAAGVTQALGSFPPPLSFALAASVAAAGAVQIATIKSQGFAKGGLAEGGIPGIDSIPAMIQRNEVIVPPKTSFQDLVDAGRSFTTDGDEAGGSQNVNVQISFTEDAAEILTAQQIENESLGIGAR